MIVFSDTAPSNSVTAVSYLNSASSGSHINENPTGTWLITAEHADVSAFIRLRDGTKGAVIINQG